MTQARASATQVKVDASTLTNPAAFQQYEQAQNQLSRVLGRLMAISERYPDLKSNENFMALQSQLEGTENRIAIARRDYNAAVQTTTPPYTSSPVLWAKTFYSGEKPMALFHRHRGGAGRAAGELRTSRRRATRRARRGPARHQPRRRPTPRRAGRLAGGHRALAPCVPAPAPGGAAFPAADRPGGGRCPRAVAQAQRTSPPSSPTSRPRPAASWWWSPCPPQGDDIEDYGYQLGRAWGIGQKDQNNGALFIVAPSEHKVRIEVGYGLEPVLTDALSSVILQEQVLPKFRSGDVEGGVVAGTNAIIDQLSLDQASAGQRPGGAAAPAAAAWAARSAAIFGSSHLLHRLRGPLPRPSRRRHGLAAADDDPAAAGGAGRRRWRQRVRRRRFRGGGGFGGGGASGNW